MAETLTHAPSASARQAQSPIHYRALHDITGRRFAYTWFTSLWTGAVLGWIESEIASRFDCDPDDVSLYEDDDGNEMVVVAGNPVAFLACCEDWYLEVVR